MCQQPKTADDIAKWSLAGQREWNISGACEPCFDGAFAESIVPIFHASTELALRRSPEAHLADTPEGTYGNHCYFGGDIFSDSLVPVEFLIDHGNSTTDEVACQPCLDRVLGAMVRASLDSAEANDYDLQEWPAEQIADDIGTYDAELDAMPSQFMVPFIERWIEEGQIAKAETGADRE